VTSCAVCEDPRVRVQTSIGVEIDLPDGWELDDDDRPIHLSPRDLDAPVQISLFEQEARGPGAPNEKSVVFLLNRVAARFAGERFETPGGDTSGEIRTTVAEASKETGFAQAWMDFWPQGADLGDPETRVFGAGVRQWPDRLLVLSWIGPVALVEHRVTARRIFDSADLIPYTRRQH
jgi:hypothetical protein